jgi:diacylglycerol kinase family enzyme
MMQAVVVNVGYGPAALKHAIETQMLLLDRLGTRLDSIRLAAPRLLHHACASALGEKPDMLVVVGGPRSARRAGQLAHKTGTPILFLPGTRAAHWAHPLWGSLSLEDMIGAIARGELTPVKLGAGMAEDQIFFGRASFGLLPHLPELRQAFEEADTFAEGWQVIGRMAQLSRLLLTPNIRFRSEDSQPHAAKAVTIKVPAPDAQLAHRRTYRPSLECTASGHGPWALVKAFLGKNAARGEAREHIEQFGCFKLRIEASAPTWILLDEEPILFRRAVEIRFVPGAIQTFAFSSAPQFANDNPKETSRRFRSFTASPEPPRNFGASTPVVIHENRVKRKT